MCYQIKSQIGFVTIDKSLSLLLHAFSFMFKLLIIFLERSTLKIYQCV